MELPSGYVLGEVGHHKQWRRPHPYHTYAELLGRGGGLATVAEAHRRIWTGVVAAVPDGAAALVVGHCGGIEPGLLACRTPTTSRGGAPFGHYDGARLGFPRGQIRKCPALRVPAELLPRNANVGRR